MHFKPKFFTLLSRMLALAFIFVLLGSRQIPAQDSQVYVTFWHAMDGQKGKVLRELVERFNMTHPGIIVDEKCVGKSERSFADAYNILFSSILENLAMKNPPDIAQVYENWTTQLIECGALVPMENFIRGQQGFNQNQLNDIFPVFLEANTYGKKIWTLPFNKSIYVLYYNKDAFWRANAAPPKTWTELRQLARKLTVSQGDYVQQYGLAFDPSVDTFGHWLYAYEGNFLTKSNEVGFNNTLGYKDIQYWVDLVNTDHSALPLPSGEALKEFQNQHAAMYIETTSKLSSMEKCNFNWGMAPLPKGSVKAYGFAGTNLAIFANSSPEKRQAAWTFVKWLLDTENTTEWAIQTGYLPVRKSAVESFQYKAYLRKNPEFTAAIDSLQHAICQPRISTWQTIRGIINDALFEAISKKKTPKKALDDAAKVIISQRYVK